MPNYFRLLTFTAVVAGGYYLYRSDYLDIRARRAPTSASQVPVFCVNPGQVALTFDDGPGQYTSGVLETLREMSVKATFHVTTAYINDVSVLTNIQRAFTEGHVIGLRYPTAMDPTKQSDSEIRNVLRDQSNKVFSVIQKHPKFLRLPYGKYDDRVIKVASSEGFFVTAWNIDTSDFETGVTAEQISNKFSEPMAVVPNGSGRYIALFHDVSNVYANRGILNRSITEVKNRQYDLVTLDKCMAEGEAYRSENGAVGKSDASVTAPSAVFASVAAFVGALF